MTCCGLREFDFLVVINAFLLSFPLIFFADFGIGMALVFFLGAAIIVFVFLDGILNIQLLKIAKRDGGLGDGPSPSSVGNLQIQSDENKRNLQIPSLHTARAHNSDSYQLKPCDFGNVDRID